MKITEKLSDMLLNENLISYNDKEIIKFGLESAIWDFVGFTMTLIIGTFFCKSTEAILLWGWLYYFRKNAGGFHAETRTGCILISAIMIIISFMMTAMIDTNNIFYILFASISGYLIWKLAPVDNSSKRLDEAEQKVYKKRCRLLLIIEEMVLVLSVIFNYGVVKRSAVMALIIVSASLTAGKIKQAATAANSASIYGFHQPKEMEVVKKYKK